MRSTSKSHEVPKGIQALALSEHLHINRDHKQLFDHTEIWINFDNW